MNGFDYLIRLFLVTDPIERVEQAIQRHEVDKRFFFVLINHAEMITQQPKFGLTCLVGMA